MKLILTLLAVLVIAWPISTDARTGLLVRERE